MVDVWRTNTNRVGYDPISRAVAQLTEQQTRNPFRPPPKISKNTDSVWLSTGVSRSCRVRKRLTGPQTAGSTAGSGVDN